ncbi:DUF2254 domain-containing protein [Hymenobacter sp. APR13]|uniref:DUF2254 domain-containing protein n=1 Tax=Hymenobacter sp. APR13 TaxID=1356852 RepID=UPI0004E03814|nr:DUF2254 domain-containing protein [Hymenobacter sp. APR13]AII54386.1 hypothetical protein N008_20660 [Hymenobacter sp. APR13]
MNRLRALWQNLNASLWFVPTLMVAGSLVLAFGLVLAEPFLDHDQLAKYPLLFGAGADGARGMLTAIAGSMITVAGLIFSLTLSTLAQVSSQYTSRVLRNFMRDRTNQLILGFFVSIFAYCLIVLRTIRGGDEGRFIPSLAVGAGLVLALLSIGVLIFFIHHMASSIQAANIIRNASQETEAAITRLFPEALGGQASAAEARQLLEQAGELRWQPVPARATGYVQSISEDSLLALARELQGVVRLEHGIGGFVARGAALVSVARYGAHPAPLPDELTGQINQLFSLGNQRTIEQDASFGLRQIVDIALKALSPGINDTTTAIICVDHLGALLALLADRQLPEPLRVADRQVRVVAVRPSFEKMVATALDQIRISAEANLGVYLRLLTALATVAQRTDHPERRAALRQQADLVMAAAERTLSTDYERQQVRERRADLLLG